MNQILTLLLLCTFIVSSSAQEEVLSVNNVVTETTPINQEYIYIKPITIEIAPIEKAIDSTPLDADMDGVIDEIDKCKNTKAGEKVDKNGCLILNDSDNDGVPDKDDKCPTTKEGTAVDDKGCEVDSDEDGIVDSKDQCPGTTKEFNVDGYGCPQTATLRVTFPPNKFNVDEKLISQLEDFALFLRQNPGYDVVIYGYTDSQGNSGINQKLSQRRADAVKEALTRYGISSIRLTAIGKGEEDPIADNSTVEGRAQNRRIEVELLQ